MSSNGKPLEWVDSDRYTAGRNAIPPDVYLQYAGKYVAVTPDGTRVLASGDSLEEVDRNLEAAGIHFSEVVHDFFDDPKDASTP